MVFSKNTEYLPKNFHRIQEYMYTKTRVQKKLFITILLSKTNTKDYREYHSTEYGKYMTLI